VPSINLHSFFAAARISVVSCINVAFDFGWQGPDAQAVAASRRLVFLAGQAVLAAELAALDATRGGTSAGPTATAAIEAAPSAGVDAVVSKRCQQLWAAAESQLSIAFTVLRKLGACGGHQAEAAFAATVAPPQVLLLWLTTLCQALVCANRGMPPGGRAGWAGAG